MDARTRFEIGLMGLYGAGHTTNFAAPTDPNVSVVTEAAARSATACNTSGDPNVSPQPAATRTYPASQE